MLPSQPSLQFWVKLIRPSSFATITTHLSCHLAMVSSLHLFRRDSEVATPVLPARMLADSTASRSIGMPPDISSAASWDTVRNAQHTRRAHNLCTESPSCIQLQFFEARAHMGAAYISVDVTALISNLRPGCLGPRVFAIIREIAAAVLLALPLAYARCCLKESRWSIMTPKYLRLGRFSNFDSSRLHFLAATYQDCFSLVRCQGETLGVEPCACSLPGIVADSFCIW